MPKRALPVDAQAGLETQVSETRNQPGRLRLRGILGIGSVGRPCERMCSHARMLDAPRARSLHAST